MNRWIKLHKFQTVASKAWPVTLFIIVVFALPAVVRSYRRFKD